MKIMFGFVIGWMLSIFATHNFGWEATIKTGWILLGMVIFFKMVIPQSEEDLRKDLIKYTTTKSRGKK